MAHGFDRPQPPSGVRSSTDLDPQFAFSYAIRSEKVEMQVLNNRFANYIEKVRVLEQKNKILLTDLEELRGKGTSQVGDLYEDEMQKLRCQVEKLTNEKDRVVVHRDNLIEEIGNLKEKLQEAEKTFKSFREYLNNADITTKGLNQKVASLQGHINFLKKLQEKAKQEMQTQQQQQYVEVDMEMVKPDLTAALKDMREQYESLAAKNVQESEEWYKSKKEAAVRNNEALKVAKQEANNFRRQVHSLTCDVKALKETKKSLERQMIEQKENFSLEIVDYQDNVVSLEDNIQNMKDKMTLNLREYQDLLNAKMALDVEIAAYRELLETGENRIPSPMSNIPPLNLRDTEPPPEEKSGEGGTDESDEGTNQDHDETD